MKNRLAPPTLSFLLVLLTSACALAEVKLETGRFYVTYSDMAYSGGLEPRIVRTYHSESQFSGIFGMGWGSEYETYLTVTGYGPIVVHESGGGAANRFWPENWNSLNRIVAEIIESARKAGDLKSLEDANNLKQRLLQEPDFIDEQWNKFSKKGLLTFLDLPLGSKVTSNRLGYEEITRVSDGYVLKDGTGGLRKFNQRGRLTRIENANADFLELTLDPNGNYSMIKDNLGRQMTITYNNRHLVEKIEGRGGEGPERVAYFRYDEQGELIQSIDDKGGVDKFEYVSSHNLSRIHFPDKNSPTWEVTYYGDDNQGKIKSFKDRDGTLTSYKYSADPKDNHDIVELEIRKNSRSKVSKETHEFFYKIKASGEKWTWREVETVDGATTETQNDENCGCPKLINAKAGQASFDYDLKGRVIRKETASETTTLKWDDPVGKVSSVEKRQKGSSKLVSATFVYDARGNLISAQSSDGRKVKVLHDGNGRISKLTYSSGQIEFTYNSDSQPKTIRVLGVAMLTVEYDDSGGVKTVKSEPQELGANAALQVSNAFDELLAITTIAKVKFSL